MYLDKQTLNTIFVYIIRHLYHDTQPVTVNMDIENNSIDLLHQYGMFQKRKKKNKTNFNENQFLTYFFNSKAHLANKYLHCGDFDPLE